MTSTFISLPPPQVPLVENRNATVAPAWYNYEKALDVTVRGLATNSRSVKLTADTTYHVATTGSSAGDGSEAHPWATIQTAYDFVSHNVDMGGGGDQQLGVAPGGRVIIKLENGTYNEASVFGRNVVGQLSCPAITIRGNTTTPSNVVVQLNSAKGFMADSHCGFQLEGMRIQNTAGNCCSAQDGGFLFVGQKVEFGTCTDTHMFAFGGGRIWALSSYSIVGAAASHVFSWASWVGLFPDGSVTITSTPAFSFAFAGATDCGVLYAPSITWTGTATGKRYDVDGNGVIQTFGATTTYFPGSTTGTDHAGRGLYY